MWQAAVEARDLLAAEWGVSADLWAVTSWATLRSEALSVERANRLHPTEEARTPLVTNALASGSGPVVAVTDYMRAVPDQVARWVGRPFTSLGTDGFGRSDARTALRRHFEVDAGHVVVAVLAALADSGEGDPEEVAKAIARFDIDPASPEPFRA
jgi:pyruvate dehydrogenase E1 component